MEILTQKMDVWRWHPVKKGSEHNELGSRLITQTKDSQNIFQMRGTLDQFFQISVTELNCF